jgi:hypothetical protein
VFDIKPEIKLVLYGFIKKRVLKAKIKYAGEHSITLAPVFAYFSRAAPGF